MPNSFEFNGGEYLLDNDPVETEIPVSEETEIEVETDVPAEEPLLEQKETSEESDQESDKEPEQSEDFMTTFLKEMGIKDGRTIIFKNEDDSEEEVDFSTLDESEKLSILKELTTPNLSQDEINVINYLRANNATIQDVIHYYSTKAVNDYISKNETREYSIDEYSDEEIYIADAKRMFPDMTDEELQADLENAKQNEDLFKKKTDALRQQYKTAEDQQLQERIQEQENRYNSFRDSVTDSLTKFESVVIDQDSSEQHVLSVEDSEREEVFRYILQKDENGATQFFKDLNDPDKLVKMAWFYKYGEQAIADITNYWKHQLKDTRKREKPVTTVKQDSKTKDSSFTNPNTYVDNVLGSHLLR